LTAGPGAESRTALGVVTFSGVSIATVFTLSVVPCIYRLLAGRTGSPNAVAHKLERMQDEAAGPPGNRGSVTGLQST